MDALLRLLFYLFRCEVGNLVVVVPLVHARGITAVLDLLPSCTLIYYSGCWDQDNGYRNVLVPIQVLRLKVFMLVYDAT